MNGCVCLGFRGDVPKEKGGTWRDGVGGSVQIIIFLSSVNISFRLYSSLSLPSSVNDGDVITSMVGLEKRSHVQKISPIVVNS